MTAVHLLGLFVAATLTLTGPAAAVLLLRGREPRDPHDAIRLPMLATIVHLMLAAPLIVIAVRVLPDAVAQPDAAESVRRVLGAWAMGGYLLSLGVATALALRWVRRATGPTS